METKLSVTEAAVLGLLAFGERSGYELAVLADEGVAYLWTPSRSQIYKVLPRLVAAGLAEAREVEQRGRPDKTLYRQTETGRAAFGAWLDEVEEEPAQGRVVFALKLFFCDFASPETALNQLAAYRAFLSSRLERYEAALPGAAESPHRYPHLVLHHGLTRVRATLAWIDGAIADVGAQSTASTSTSTSTPSGMKPAT